MTANNEKENELVSKGYKFICGIDESGMGCFAADVFVGLVIFSPNIDYKMLMPGLNDSKQKTPEQRAVLYDQVRQNALSYVTATASVNEIDHLNIYWARFLAVYRALNKISIKPDHVIIDGNKVIPEPHQMIEKIKAGYSANIGDEGELKYSLEKVKQLSVEINSVQLPTQMAIVKGDGKCISIAAASILAKVERDQHIDELAKLVHPDYNWINNKSYYCEKQIAAIKKYGKTPYHRETYVRKYLEP